MGKSWCLGVSSVGLVVSGLYRGDSGLGWHVEREGGEGSREVDGGDEGGEGSGCQCCLQIFPTKP